jgi:hypothetical protein
MIEVHVEGNIGELQHDYNLFGSERNHHTLYYSNNPSWVEGIRGQQVGCLQDTGDGYIIEIDDCKKIKIDYSDAIKLLTLLAAANDSKIEFRETKVVKTL